MQTKGPSFRSLHRILLEGSKPVRREEVSGPQVDIIVDGVCKQFALMLGRNDPASSFTHTFRVGPSVNSRYVPSYDARNDSCAAKMRNDGASWFSLMVCHA